MAALRREGPTKDYEGLKRRRQWWAMDKIEGGLKPDPGGAPVSTAPFPELVSESAAISWAEIDATKGFGPEKGSMVSLYGPRRRTSPKVSSVEEWW